MLGVDSRVIARDAAGAVLFTSEANGNGPTLTVRTMALQADGKVLVGGSRNTGGMANYPEERTLVRLNLDGTADTSFQGGRVYRDPSAYDEAVLALTVAPDGRIVVAGSHRMGPRTI